MFFTLDALLVVVYAGICIIPCGMLSAHLEFKRPETLKYLVNTASFFLIREFFPDLRILFS